MIKQLLGRHGGRRGGATVPRGARDAQHHYQRSSSYGHRDCWLLPSQLHRSDLSSCKTRTGTAFFGADTDMSVRGYERTFTFPFHGFHCLSSFVSSLHFFPALQNRDLLIRIWIRGSVPLKNGSGFQSGFQFGSWYFRQ
jgi:hypothetical protein